MPEQSTTPDLVELMRRFIEASNGGAEAFVSCFAPDAVFDLAAYGIGTYEGLEAIRRFYEDWISAFDEFAVEAEEVLDLGNGVAFSAYVMTGRPPGSSGGLRVRYAAVTIWVKGLIVRVTNSDDFDATRAAAERLAEERG